MSEWSCACETLAKPESKRFCASVDSEEHMVPVKAVEASPKDYMRLQDLPSAGEWLAYMTREAPGPGRTQAEAQRLLVEELNAVASKPKVTNWRLNETFHRFGRCSNRTSRSTEVSLICVSHFTGLLP